MVGRERRMRITTEREALSALEHLLPLLPLPPPPLLEALQLQRSFGLLNQFLPFGPVSDAVLPVCYFHPCYIALYIIIPSIFRSS